MFAVLTRFLTLSLHNARSSRKGAEWEGNVSGKEGKFVRRWQRVGRGREVGVSRRKDRVSYEIRLSYPPTPTTAQRSWRRWQPPNADTMVDSCCWLRCFLCVAFLRRAALKRVGPAAFLLRCRDEKNLSATGISVRLLQVFCDAARSRQNKEESLIRRHYLLRL